METMGHPIAWCGVKEEALLMISALESRGRDNKDDLVATFTCEPDEESLQGGFLVFANINCEHDKSVDGKRRVDARLDLLATCCTFFNMGILAQKYGLSQG